MSRALQIRTKGDRSKLMQQPASPRQISAHVGMVCVAIFCVDPIAASDKLRHAPSAPRRHPFLVCKLPGHRNRKLRLRGKTHHPQENATLFIDARPHRHAIVVWRLIVPRAVSFLSLVSVSSLSDNRTCVPDGDGGGVTHRITGDSISPRKPPQTLLRSHGWCHVAVVCAIDTTPGDPAPRAWASPLRDICSSCKTLFEGGGGGAPPPRKNALSGK